MGGRGRGGGKRGGVSFNKPPEPAFLRKIKEQLGFQEGPNVDTKRAELDKATEEDEQDKDDERPTVVVLKSGDLTAEEAEKFGVFDTETEDDTGESSSGRVMFKKPTKRAADANSEENNIRNKLEKKESSMKKVKNKTLLSFDDEEDDDEDSDSE